MNELRSVTGAEEDIRALAAARSVAIVGASTKPFTPSWWPLELLKRLGFQGAIYPVNPNRDEIEGVKCYPDIGSLPGPVDVAILVVAAERVPETARACAEAGTRVIVVAAQGFSEAGPEGAALEAELAAAAREHGARIVGPNTDGLACFGSGVVASIQPILGEGLPLGPVAIVAQSGATAASIIGRLKNEGVGCRYAISTGNECDLGIADYLSFVVQDPEVEVVLAFIESIRRPDDFRAAAALAADLGKPIALIKVGASEQAARRTAAHTGALAGDDAVYDAVFAADAVLRVSEPSELVAIAKLVVTGRRPRGRGVGIISVSGGGASIVADKAVALGLDVPAISTQAEAEINAKLSFGGAFNPCDTTGEIATAPQLAADVYDVFAKQPEIGAVVYARKHLTGTIGERAAHGLSVSSGAAGATPLVVYAMDGVVERAEEAAVWTEYGVPVFGSLQDVFVGLDRLCRHAELLERRAARNGVRPVSDPRLNAGGLDDVLAASGIAVPQEGVVASAEAAADLADAIGYPVVLKVADERILHRTEVGAVVTGVGDRDAVVAAFARVRERAREHLGGAEPAGVLVQEQVVGGVELILGARIDPQFGPVVVVGAGGVLAEVARDAALRPAPISADEARELLGELRAAELLAGFRGAPPADIAAAAEAIAGLSRFVAAHAAELEAIDINPLIVLPEGRGVRAVDLLVIPAP